MRYSKVSQEVRSFCAQRWDGIIAGARRPIGEVPAEIWVPLGALKEWLSQYRSDSTEASRASTYTRSFALPWKKAKQRADTGRWSIRWKERVMLPFSWILALSGSGRRLLKMRSRTRLTEGSSVVTIEERENRIWVHVKDSGVGITEENQRYIFDGLFHTKKQRCMPPRTPTTSGRGKGLDLLRMRLYARRLVSKFR